MNSLKKLFREDVKKRLKSFQNSESFNAASDVEKIREKLLTFEPFRRARSLMIYLNLPGEFPTFPLLNDLFFLAMDLPGGSRSISVPWCDGRSLRLFQLHSPEFYDPRLSYFETDHFRSDFAPGAYGIWEPKPQCRTDRRREVSPKDLDLILVPGLAFDRNRNRLGRGAGFYDRFFENVRSETILTALAFDEQIFDTVPTEPHDRRMDFILTPNEIYPAG